MVFSDFVDITTNFILLFVRSLAVCLMHSFILS